MFIDTLILSHRDILGPDMTFIHFEMSSEDKKKRLTKRHEGMGEGGDKIVDMLEVSNIMIILHMAKYKIIIFTYLWESDCEG